MTEIQIWVRTIYHDPKEFKGRKYTEHKLYSTDGLYYTSSKPYDPAIQEGSDVLLDAEPTKNPKYFKTKKVIAFNMHQKPQASSQATKPNIQSGQGGLPNPNPIPLPAIPELNPKLQATWIKNAIEAMKLAELDPDIENAMLVKLVEQYGEDRMNEKIERQQKARWGK